MEPGTRWDRSTLKVLETEVEPQRRAVEAKPGCRKTEEEPVYPRTKVKLTKSCKTTAMAER